MSNFFILRKAWVTAAIFFLSDRSSSGPTPALPAPQSPRSAAGVGPLELSDVELLHFEEGLGHRGHLLLVRSELGRAYAGAPCPPIPALSRRRRPARAQRCRTSSF